MIFDFRVMTDVATIYSIKVSDLDELAKKDIELADGLKRTRAEIKFGQKSDFDFFRFLPPFIDESDSDEDSFAEKHIMRKEAVRLKFKQQLLSICRRI